MKASGPGLLFVESFLITTSNSVLVIGLLYFLFPPDSVLGDHTFLRICPFLPGRPYYCHTVTCNSLLKFFAFLPVSSILLLSSVTIPITISLNTLSAKFFFLFHWLFFSCFLLFLGCTCMKISLCHLPLPSASVGDLDLKWAWVILTSGSPVCHHLGGRWDEDQLSRVGTRRESGMLSSQHCPLGDTVQSQSSGWIPETWVWAGSIPFKCPSPIHSTILALKILWTKEPSRATVYGFSRSQTWLSDWAGRSTLSTPRSAPWVLILNWILNQGGQHWSKMGQSWPQCRLQHVLGVVLAH